MAAHVYEDALGLRSPMLISNYLAVCIQCIPHPIFWIMYTYQYRLYVHSPRLSLPFSVKDLDVPTSPISTHNIVYLRCDRPLNFGGKSCYETCDLSSSYTFSRYLPIRPEKSTLNLLCRVRGRTYETFRMHTIEICCNDYDEDLSYHRILLCFVLYNYVM